MSAATFNTGFCPFKTKEVGGMGEQCIPDCELYIKDQGCVFLLLLKENREINEKLDFLVAASS